MIQDRGKKQLHRALLPAALVGALALGACGDGGAPTDGSSGAGDTAVESATRDVEGGGAPDRDSLVATYDEGLDFLRSQAQDGIWTVQEQPSVGYTAMCVTNFLERPGGPREADSELITKALDFVAASIGDDGSVDEAYRPNYETSVVIMALTAAGEAEYEDEIERAKGFIYQLQRLEEDNPTWGGIGYGSDNTRSDLSNTNYALASLRAAGVPEDDPVFQRALTFLQRVQNRKENETAGEPAEWTDKDTGQKLVRGDDGGANYFPGNSKAGYDERPDGIGVLRSYGSMTYALLRCYHFAGLDLSDGRVQAAVDWIADNWALDHNPGMSGDDRHSGQYYMYATMAKALTIAEIETLDVSGEGPLDWSDTLAAHLVAEQRDDGSWINDDSERWMEGNPVLATSYALTALAELVE